MPYFARLDALRGYCVLGVFGFHAGLMDFGWVGVNAFFVLSGFLITGILIGLRDARAPGLASFYVRRSLRILPAVYVYLFVILAIGLCIQPYLPGAMTSLSDSLPYLVTFTDNVHALDPNYVNSDYFSHLWSIAVEEQFYLVWPLLVLLTPRRFLAHVCVMAVLTALLFRTGLYVSEAGDHLRHYAAGRLPFASCDAFALGALLRIVRLPDAVRTPRTLLVSGVLVILVGFAGEMSAGAGPYPPSLWSLGWNPVLSGAWGEIWRGTALGLFFAHLIAILTRPAPAPALFDRAFDNVVARRIGLVSYGFYIYHDPLVAVAKTLGWIEPSMKYLYLAAALAGTWLLASLSHRYVETPFLALKRLWPYHGASSAGREEPSPSGATRSPEAAMAG